MYTTCNSMNNLLSHCGLVDARTSASEKDLPVQEGAHSLSHRVQKDRTDDASRKARATTYCYCAVHSTTYTGDFDLLEGRQQQSR